MAHPRSGVSDFSLLELAKSGSPDAFEALCVRHSNQIYRTSLKMLRNREDAEDNLQNTLCKAFCRLDQFNAESQFSTWLTRIAINEALMFLRKQRSTKMQDCCSIGDEEDGQWLEPSDLRPNPEREFATRELAAKSLEELTPGIRSLFVRQKLEGWTNAELGRAIGVPAERVKYRMFRARAILKERVNSLSSLPRGPLARSAQTALPSSGF